jgi:two-component system nitrogen regulation response regulator GlnG
MEMRGFAPEVLERFQCYAWPGNVRELQGAIKQAMLNASGHLILPEFLGDGFAAAPPRDRTRVSDFPNLARFIDKLLHDGSDQLHDTVIAAVERVLFTKVLEHTRGNQGKACDLLGLNRSTLRHRLRTLGLAVDKVPIDTSHKPQGES